MASATEQKTEALATKLAEARKDADSAKGKAGSNPASVAAQRDPGVRTEGLTVPQQQIITPDPWAERVLTFKTKLGGWRSSLAILHATIGSEDVNKVTAENYKPVWTAMEAACKKAGDAVPVGAPPKGSLF